MAINRVIEELPSRLGNFIELVEQKIKEKGKVKILDAGCGHGSAMMGFIEKFGNQVEMYGFNYSFHYGNPDLMIEDVIEKGLFTKEQINEIKNLPKFIYGDASEILPFNDGYFDFIYSMHAVHYFDDKIKFLEECNRILKKEGVARINGAFGTVGVHYMREHTSPAYSSFWEIWDKGKEIKIWDYCERIKGVEFIGKPIGFKERGDYTPEYIQIIKQPSLDFKLILVSSIDANFIWEEWSGVKSVYTTQREFEPKWKKK